jgi:hypothetical protein
MARLKKRPTRTDGHKKKAKQARASKKPAKKKTPAPGGARLARKRPPKKTPATTTGIPTDHLNVRTETMTDSTLEQRVEWLQRGLREIGKMCLQLGSDGQADGDRRAQQAGFPNIPSAGAAVPLTQFLASVQDLTLADRMEVVDAAIAMLSEVYVHLPLKRALHGIDPVQRLRLLRQRVALQISGIDAEESARAFHGEMIEIFHSLRDLHTNYILPGSYHGMTAFLPFLVQECYEGNPPVRKYIVVRVQPGFTHSTFKPDVTITSWNGVPIERAVELNASREAGSNADARHARGLEALTLRPMALTAPPDDAWVIIGYGSNDQNFEQRFYWQVTAPIAPASGAAADDGQIWDVDSAHVMGFDAQTMAAQRARKSLFFPEAVGEEARMALIVAGAASPAAVDAARSTAAYGGPSGSSSRARFTTRFADMAAAERGINDAAASALAAANLSAGQAPASGAAEGPDTSSLLPEFFTFRKVSTSLGTFGYLRIYSFMALDVNGFVAEFTRILKLLPQNGLMIDVRGNGGGNINAGERLLQILTANQITPEPFQFINSPSTLELCKGISGLTSWIESVELGWQISETYSQGFPLTSEQSANSGPTYRYPSRVVLLIDALCYSTTDIFTAGFQDHGIGKILGTSGRTGAGGANVWDYNAFMFLPDFKSLPKGVSFRSAIRRSTRVRDKAGVPLEDLGVKPNEIHQMTRKDILEGNSDLLEHAAKLLSQP